MSEGPIESCEDQMATEAAQEGEEQKLPFATEQLLSATELLERGAGENGPLTLPEVMEAQALALMSIAATVLDLAGLIEDELAWRRSQRPAQSTDVEEGSGDQDSAYRSLGPGEDPNFSFTGR